MTSLRRINASNPFRRFGVVENDTPVTDNVEAPKDSDSRKLIDKKGKYSIESGYKNENPKLEKIEKWLKKYWVRILFGMVGFAVIFTIIFVVVNSIDNDPHTGFGQLYNEHVQDHHLIKGALRGAGFGYSERDSAAHVADSILKSEKIRTHCKQGIDEMCYYPGQSTPNEYGPANLHLWNPIRHFSGPYSINLDELDDMEERISASYAEAENRLAKQDSPNQHLGMPPATGNYPYEKRQTYEEMRKQGVGYGGTVEGSGQGRGLGNTKNAHLQRLVEMGIVPSSKGMGRVTKSEVHAHYKKLRDTLESFGMGYHSGHAASFGSSYLTDIAKRKAFVSQGCTTGIVDPNTELCQYPLFSSDVPRVRPSQGEGTPAMFDLRLLEKRHNEIAEWIEKTNNQVDTTDRMVMRPTYYTLEGEVSNVAQRGTRASQYLRKPMELNVKVGRANNAGVDMQPRASPDYFSEIERASAPPPSQVRQFQDLTLNQQLQAQQDRISDSLENRETLLGNNRQTLLENSRGGSFGYSGSETKGTMLKRLANRKALISNNCTSGRGGFDEACAYPLYRQTVPLTSSSWSYPNADKTYPFHVKP